MPSPYSRIGRQQCYLGNLDFTTKIIDIWIIKIIIIFTMTIIIIMIMIWFLTNTLIRLTTLIIILLTDNLIIMTTIMTTPIIGILILTLIRHEPWPWFTSSTIQLLSFSSMLRYTKLSFCHHFVSITFLVIIMNVSNTFSFFNVAVVILSSLTLL